MAFVDEAKIFIHAGAGGNGVVSWHREPYKPRGGPDGGNGGDGGSVILRAAGSIGTLLELRDHPHVSAARGEHGRGSKRDGARGRDRVVLVPPGTMVFDATDGTLIADLPNEGDEFVAARGGRGGRGNASFATSVRRAPDFAEKGEPGEERSFRLELRLLADVGLVGFPNAGKSTLIARVSGARPKIAAYPFTTLEPKLGVVVRRDRSWIVADIPGLVPGASQGKGLGHRFLRHVSRAAVLVFLVDLAAFDRDPAGDVDVLRAELAAYDPELASRPQVIAANKVDAAREVFPRVLEQHPDALALSAVTGEGLDELLDRLDGLVAAARADEPARVAYVRHVTRDDPIRVEREDGAWRVRGARAERAVAAADLANASSVRRMQRHLVSLGVEKMLAAAGATAGDEVRIGEANFDFEPEAGDGEI